MDILGLAGRFLLYVPAPLAVSPYGLRRLDDFNVEARAERREVGHSEVVLSRVCLGRQGRIVTELGQAKGGQDGDDVGVVTEVKVEGLVQGKGLHVRVERGVDLRARVAEGVVFEAGNDFLLVADADGASGLGLPAAIAGEEEVYGLLMLEAREFIQGVLDRRYA